MLKAVLFDLDDTLLDWRGFTGWEAFEREGLQRVHDYICHDCYSLPDFDTFRNTFRSLTALAWNDAEQRTHFAPHMGEVLVKAAEHLGAPQGVLDPQRCLREHGWRRIDGTAIFPDVLDALALLCEHNIRVGIVTNAYQPMWMRDIEIEAHGLMGYFPDCRIAAADAGYIKPHPAIFRQALELLDTAPDEAVFVGDNPIADINGAQRVGMKAVLRKNGQLPAEIGLIVQPDGIIHSLLELSTVLDEWYPGWGQ